MLKRQETKKISRKELYDLVWTKPIMDIAEQIEASINDIYTNVLQMLLIKREKTIKEEIERNIREERKKQERIRKKKIEVLLTETQDFVLAKSIRDYIKSKEKAFSEGKVEMIDFEEWKQFGLNYADELDSSFKPEVVVVDDNYSERRWY